MKRITILVEKNQSPGQIGNICAILMGQAALVNPEIFSNEPVLDLNETQHAGIKYSTIILKAGSGQLLNLIEQAKEYSNEVSCITFTGIGQGLHNQFEEYKSRLSKVSTNESSPVGVILSGEEDILKQLTKKFSLLQ